MSTAKLNYEDQFMASKKPSNLSNISRDEPVPDIYVQRVKNSLGGEKLISINRRNAS